MTRGTLLLALAAAACSEPPPRDPGPLLTISVSPTPASVGPGRVLVALADASGSPIGGATVVVSGRAPDGRAEAVVHTAREQASGSYAAPAFPFDVPGDWTLEARARLPDGGAATATHPIRVVARPTRP